MTARAVVALALALVAALAAAGPVRADGDPASDVLVMQDVYYPYAPPTDAKLRRALDATLAKARGAGYPLKVALINTPSDLGAYPQLFNRANDYATLLARELPANRHGPRLEGQSILVVMPGGFGGSNLGDRVDEALGGIEVVADAGSNGLAVAALNAVPALAKVNGHDVPVPPEADIVPTAGGGGDEGGGGGGVLVYLVPALILFGGLFAAGRIARRRQEPEQEPDTAS